MVVVYFHFCKEFFMSAEQSYGNTGPVSVNKGYSIVSIIRAIVIGGIAVWLISFLYGPISHWLPDARLNFILVAGFGWVVSLVVNFMLKHQRICDTVPALIVAGVIGLIAIWGAWLSYIWTLTGYDFSEYIDFMLHPNYIWNVALYIAHDPVWTLSKSSDGHPYMYYAVWLIEFAIVVGFPMLMAMSYLKENKVCDDCRDWLRKTDDTAMFLLPEEGGEQILANLQQGDVSALSTLTRLSADGEAPAWVEVHGYACPNCQNKDSFVTVNWVYLKQVKKDKVERVSDVLSRYVPVTVEMEKAIFEPAAAPAVATAAE